MLIEEGKSKASFSLVTASLSGYLLSKGTTLTYNFLHGVEAGGMDKVSSQLSQF